MQIFFFGSRSPHAARRRSSGLLHPQHHITPQAPLCRVCVCRPLLIVRLLPQPAITVGSAPLCPKSRNALKRAGVNFFRAVSRSQYYSPLRKLRSVPILRWLFDCRNTATALLTNKKENSASYVSFFICCGAWGCLIAPETSR